MSSAKDQASRRFMEKQAGSLNPEELIRGIQQGERQALARALTLVESENAEHRALAREVIEACLQQANGKTQNSTLRIGITGVPGVGKSSFIERLGLILIGRGYRVAVQAVDPSSEISGGSILGDKTRMEKLSAHAQAFIRPSPARGTLGGVADRTREHILLFEAAGYDLTLIETVGVGQSETAVHGMVDCLLLLLLPGAGDELQGIKRGIVEMADILAVNKSDGDNQQRARNTQRDYQQALHLFPPASEDWTVPVLRCSAITGEGMEELCQTLLNYRDQMQANGSFARRRQSQSAEWLHEAIRDALSEDFYNDPEIARLLAAEETEVQNGSVHPLRAAERLIERFRKKQNADTAL